MSRWPPRFPVRRAASLRTFEFALDRNGLGPVAGVDEAGRGPLAGPVAVAAVILHPRRRIDGLDDSKKLTETRREALFPLIQERALAWRVVFVEPDEIDRLNIYWATMKAMTLAATKLLETVTCW